MANTAVDFPIALLTRQDSGALTWASTTSWTPTSASLTVPASLSNGWYWLRIAAAGVASPAKPVLILAPGTVASFSVTGFASPATPGAPSTFTVTARNALGATVTGYVGTVHFTSSDGAAVLPANYTFTGADSGSHTFSATLNTTGTQSLSVNDVASTSLRGSQTGIQVGTVPVATKVAFTVQPSNAAAGAALAPAVQVAIQDASGNVVTTSTASVTLALSNNPGGSALSGTVTVAAVNGVASFSTLSLNKVGTGYTLAASSSGLTGATSSGFNITPGAASLLVYAVQPSSAVATAALAPAVQVAIHDASGNVVTTSSASVTVALSSNPGGSTLSGTVTVAAVSGVASFSTLSLNKVGTGYTLAASSSGLTGATSTGFNITPGTASQLVYSVQPSNAVAGAPLAPAVQVAVQDASGNLVTTSTASVTLALSNNPGSSTLSGTVTVAAVSGVASFSTMSLNKVGTGYTLAATASGLTGATSSGFNITPGTATQLAYSVQPSNAAAGAALSPAVQVRIVDGLGNVITTSSASVTVALANNPGGSTLSGTVTVAAVSGVASFSTLSLNKVGTGYTLAASSSGLTGATSSGFNITPGTASQLVYSVQPSSAVAGAALAPAVQVAIQDASGNVVTTSTASVTLSLASNPGGSTLSGTVTVAAVSGVASFSTLSLNKVGTGYTLAATASGLTGATSSGFNITAGAATQLVYSVQPSNAAAGAALAPAVQVAVRDSLGNTVTTSTASVTLALSSNPGGSTLSGTVTVAAVSGVASFSTLSLNKVGTGYTLAATASGLTGATSSGFNITAGTATQLAYSVQPSDAVAATTLAPAVQVAIQDASGNLVTTSTASVTLALASNPGGSTLSGTVTVAAVGGVASFSTLSLNKVGTGYTLAATASGLGGATSSGFNITSGAAGQLVFAVQPPSAVAGAALAPAVRVEIQDGSGNVITTSSASVTVSLANNPGGSTLSGTVTVAAVSGVASFSTLSLDKVGTGYTLVANSAGLTGATSSGFNITAGTASQLVYSVQPSNAVAGAALAPAVQVAIQDAAGNVVTTSTASVTLSLASNPGGSTLSGTLTVAAVSGVASFSTLSLNRVGTGYTLAATASGLTGATSSGFNISTGAATQLVYSVQPSNAVAGAALAPAVQVAIRDASGNVVTTSTVSVTLALASNPGGSTLSGTVSVSAVSGVASFSALSLNRVGTGYTLAASASGLSGATSSAFNITAGAATQLVYSVQPSTAVAGAALAPAVRVAVQDASGNVVTISTASVTLALASNPGGSTLSGTVTAAAVSGVASFSSLSLNKVGAGYTLAASASGLTGATSSGFNITPAAATQLVFSVQPSNAVAGSAFAPAVQAAIQDALGNVATASTASVTLALASNPGGSTLSGTVTVAAVNGVASFSTLSLNRVGTGYTLAATASGLSGATSSSFDVIAGAPSALRFTSSSQTLTAGACSAAVTVQTLDAQGNVSPVSAATALALASSSSATNQFFSDAVCSNPVTSTSLTSGSSAVSFYFADTLAGGRTLTVSSGGLGSAMQAETIQAGAAKSFVVAGFPSPTTSNLAGSFTVSAVDLYGNLSTGYAGTVSFSSSDGSAQLPAAFTFAGAATQMFSATLVTAGSQSLTVTSADLPPLSGTQSNIQVFPASAVSLRVFGVQSPLPAGTRSDVQVEILDGAGNVLPTYSGTVHFTSSDALAQLPADYTFIAADLGRHTFSAAVSFTTVGAQTLTAVDTAASTLTGSANISVTAPVAPLILHDAVATAALGQRYPYNAEGRVTAEGDEPMSFSVCGGPPGFGVDAQSGVVVWTPSAAGVVSLCVAAQNAAGQASYTFSVQVLGAAIGAAPTAGFTATPPSGVAPLAVAFDGSASTADPSTALVAYRWDYGDMSPTGVGRLSSHSYLLPGGYQTRLTVVDGVGRTATTQLPLLVTEQGRRPPLVRIIASALSGTDSLTVSFSSQLDAGDAQEVSSFWDFGGGSTSEEASPTFTFGPGRHSVRLRAVDSAGLTAADTVEVVVSSGTFLPPTCSAFSQPAAAVASATVHFLAAFAASDGSPVQSLWTFSDGSTATGVDVARTFPLPAYYSARLTVTDSRGLTCSQRVDAVVTAIDGTIPPKIFSTSSRKAVCGLPYVYSTLGHPVAAGSAPITWYLEDSSAKISTLDDKGTPDWTATRDQVGLQRLVLQATNSAGEDRQVILVDVTCDPGPNLRVSVGCSSADGWPLSSFLLLAGFLARRRRQGRTWINPAIPASTLSGQK